MTINQDGDTSEGSPNNTGPEASTTDASTEGSQAGGDGLPAGAEAAGEVVGGFDNPEEATAGGPLGSFFSGEHQEVSGSIDQPAAGDGASEGGASGDEGTEPDTEEGGDGGAEANTEAKADEKPTAEGESEEGEGRQARRDEWLGRVQEETGIQAESTDELTEQVNRLKTQNEGFHELQQIVESNAGFQRMLSEMADGKTPAEAAAALDGVTTEAPDPNENPEAYAEWKAAQKMKEQQQQREQEQQSDREQKIQREKRRLESEFQNVVQNNDLSDEEAQALGETLARLTVSQPGASLRAKDLEALRKGMQHDQLVEQKVEQARKEARENVLAKVRGDGTIDAEADLPDLRTGGGPSEDEQGSGVQDEQLQQAFGPTQRDTTDLHGRV